MKASLLCDVRGCRQGNSTLAHVRSSSEGESLIQCSSFQVHTSKAPDLPLCSFCKAKARKTGLLPVWVRWKPADWGNLLSAEFQLCCTAACERHRQSGFKLQYMCVRNGNGQLSFLVCSLSSKAVAASWSIFAHSHEVCLVRSIDRQLTSPRLAGCTSFAS